MSELSPPIAPLPIGAIVRDLESALKLAHDYCGLDGVVATWRMFDRRFVDRLDYRIWRLALPPKFSVYRQDLGPPEASSPPEWGLWSTNMSDALESSDPVVIWSVLAISPEIIERSIVMGEIANDTPLWPFVNRLYELLEGGLVPLPTAPASCGIAASMFLTRLQNLQEKAGQPIDLVQCERFIQHINTWLRISDPDWAPGKKLNVDQVIAERSGPNRLRPGHPSHEFSLLSNMLGIIRPTISLTVREFNDRTETLLDLAYKYSLTAWLTARSRRISEEQFQSARNWGDDERGEASLKRAYLKEFDCHLNACSAARDAGKYLENAKLLYLLFRLMPDACRKLPEVEQEFTGRRTIVFRYLKEAGFEPDPRFARCDPSPQDVARIEEVRIRRVEHWDARREAGRSGKLAACARLENETGFALRMRADQELPIWRTLLSELPPEPRETPVGYLLSIIKNLADGGLAASPAALQAAFNLCLRYGYIRSAEKLLNRSVHHGEFELTPTILLDFVHSVRRCTRLDPFGILQERLAIWHNLIRCAADALYKAHGSAWIHSDDRLWIHDTLNNRAQVHHVGLSQGHARRLFEKSAGVFSGEDLRVFYDLSYNFDRTTPGTANIDTIAAWLGKYAETPLGRPVAVSVASMGSALSVLAIGCEGETVAEDCLVDNINEEVASLLDQAQFWFKLEDADPNQEIAWPVGLRQAAQTINRVAEACDPTARVILLSVDSSLAQLPWQNAINLGRSPTSRLVSIVPNLSALTWRQPPRDAVGLVTILSEDPESEIRTVVDAVRETTDYLDLAEAGVCVAVGHGERPQTGGLPCLRLGKDRIIATIDEWLDVATARVNIFHCCHLGVPEPLFMKEFGGIVGMAMALGAKAFVAPVGEVLPSMAISLQKRLFARPSRSIGEAYLDAIACAPGCCLYNLYGNPFEAIQPKAVSRRSLADWQLA